MKNNYSLPREVYASEEHKFLRETIAEYFKNEIAPNREAWEKTGQ